MKRCPACNQTYSDDELSFCVNDGTALVRAASSSDLQATIMSPPPSPTSSPPPPPSFDEAGQAGWNAPSSYSPPQSWNTPGAWQPPTPQPMQGVPPARIAQVGRQQPQPLAIASLICGLISITFGLICGGPFIGIIAIVLGIVALVQIKNDPQRYGGKGIAIGGIAIGSLRIFFTLLWLLVSIIGALAR